jgi:hypothetical protein
MLTIASIALTGFRCTFDLQLRADSDRSYRVKENSTRFAMAGLQPGLLLFAGRFFPTGLALTSGKRTERVLFEWFLPGSNSGQGRFLSSRTHARDAAPLQPFASVNVTNKHKEPDS